jgi:hypothetical protein
MEIGFKLVVDERNSRIQTLSNAQLFQASFLQ